MIALPRLRICDIDIVWEEVVGIGIMDDEILTKIGIETEVEIGKENGIDISEITYDSVGCDMEVHAIDGTCGGDDS